MLHTETDGYGHQENETKVYHRPQIFALKNEREIPNVAVLQPIVLRSIKFANLLICSSFYGKLFIWYSALRREANPNTG